MANSSARRWRLSAAAILMFCAPVRSQEAATEDDAINTIRQLPQISAADQRRIADWIEAQVAKVAAAPKEERQAAATTLRHTLKTQYDNPSNSPPFRGQLAAQTAKIAAAKFAEAQAERWVAFGLARALVDFNNFEALPGLLAALKSPEESIRYQGADGLAALQPTIAAEKKLGDVLPALREAGTAEVSPIVLARIYAALAYPAEGGAVLESYLAVFEKRLQLRRRGGGTGDGAETQAYEFFRNPAVLNAFTPAQKEQLTRPLAVFLRLDAERYNSANLSFGEIDRLERALDGAEAVLAEIAGPGKGGKIRDEIEKGGHDNRAQVLSETHKWVGNAQTNESGALNSAPWNVPVGAP